MHLDLDERNRIDALQSTHLLDTLPEERFDRLTRMASRILGTDIALISLIDTDRQWFKSRIGLDAVQTPRDQAFCDHAIRTPNDVMVVLDAKTDSRFADNPLVTGDPNISFYAGAPLVTANGQALGTLCVIDPVARDEFSQVDQQVLRDLAATVISEIDLADANQRNADLNIINEELRHRMGNMYAHISGLVSMLGRSDANRDQLIRRIREKISVLSQTQSMLAANKYKTVSLRELVEATLAPFGVSRNNADGRITVQTDADIQVSARSAFTLTLMLNELATNAMKHGALSHDDGKVEFSWITTPAPRLSWRETFATPAKSNAIEFREGFGTQILRKIVPMDFQGEAELDLGPNGLTYHVSALPERLFETTTAG